MINLNDIIKPISKKSVVGVDPRCASPEIESIYRNIKDARNEARLTERMHFQGEGPDLSRRYWEEVYENSTNLLVTSCKDLQVVAWLIESLLRLKGFAGLSDAFLIVNKLVAKFKHQLFPMLEEDEGIEAKLQALTGLNGEEVAGSLVQPIYNVPLSLNPQYSLWQYQQSLQSKNDLANSSYKNSGLVDLNEIIKAVASTSSDFYRQLTTDLTAAIDQFNQLNKTLDKVFAKDAPPCTRILDALLDYKKQLSILLRQNNLHLSVFNGDCSLEQKCNANVEVDSANLGASAAMSLQKLGSITNTNCELGYTRETALRELVNIAEFFKFTEPQSILPYMLARVTEWAKLPLPDLLAKMVTNSTELAQVYALTGVNPTKTD